MIYLIKIEWTGQIVRINQIDETNGNYKLKAKVCKIKWWELYNIYNNTK